MKHEAGPRPEADCLIFCKLDTDKSGKATELLTIVAELGENIPFDKLIGSKIICCLYILFEASQNA